MSAEDALLAQVKGQVLAGVYRHYKGPLYLALGLAHDANADELIHEDTLANGGPVERLGERVCIAYVPLQTDGAKSGPALVFRTRSNFEEWIVPGQRLDGHGAGEFRPLSPAEVNRYGTKIIREQGYLPRFEYLGAERPIQH